MKTAFVLSGGGALGAFEAGAIRALAAQGIEPDIIAGTSAGALNAAGLAIGLTPDEVCDIWLNTRRRNVIQLRRDYGKLFDWKAFRQREGNLSDRALGAVGWSWLYDTAPLKETLTNLLQGDTAKIKTGKTLVVSAVDMLSAELLRYTNQLPTHQQSLTFKQTDIGVPHLMASAAIPVIFKPALVDGRWMWDGGLIANTPLKAALAYRPDKVYVISASPLINRPMRPRNLSESVSLLMNNLLHHTVMADLRRALETNQICATDPYSGDKRCVDMTLIQPEKDEGTTAMLDFSKASAARLIAEGEKVAVEALKRG